MLSASNDITNREPTETEFRALGKFLEIANRHSEMTSLLQEFVEEIKEGTCCEAVGIRLRAEDGKIPYTAYQGYNRQFYETESLLSIKTDPGLWFKVVEGTADPQPPFYTEGGSFYVNGTTPFPSPVAEEDRVQIRNFCHQAGYESFALIPIRVDSRLLGLIHLADGKENRIPLNRVKLLEQVASVLGAGIQRVLAEEELRRQREWLRVTLASIGDAVIATDAEGRITFLNSAGAALTGWPLEEARGQTLRDVFRIVNEKTKEPAEDPVARVLRERKVVELANDTTLVTKDGLEIPIKDSAAPILDASGNLTGVVVVFHDVTQQRRAQEAIFQAEREWEQTFNSVPDLVAILDDHHRVVRVNKAMADRLGVPAEKCIGLHCYEAVHGMSEVPGFCPHARTCQDGQQHFAEVHEPRLQGYFLVSTTPLRNAQGRFIGSAHIARDITDRKRAEEALKMAHDELELRVRERTSELSAVVERLRIEIVQRRQLEDSLRESENQVRFFASQCLIAQETERKRVAGELHDSIAASLGALKFRIENTAEKMNQGQSGPESLRELAGQVTGVITEVRRIMADLRPALLDDLGIIAALNWFCREFEKTYTQISVEKEVRLSEPVVPDSLKTAIFRITQEALHNIAKYSRASRVYLRLQEKEGAIEMVIRDNGQGFDLETVKKGLGLSTMRERAQLSGGTFDLQAAPGKGTRIRVSWPQA
ncbi:MAG: PAS domain-containing protein [Deltaproteobacteria bacterium]|nr:PAS domain-containing protein [Deltaproteobacteria bacterium]